MMDVVIVRAAVLDAKPEVVTPWPSFIPLHFFHDLDEHPEVEAPELERTRGRRSPAKRRPGRKRS